MKLLIDSIKEFCEHNDYEFICDYSGRFMYGRTCVGIVTNYGQNYLAMLMELVAWLQCDDLEDDFNIYDLGEPMMDDMGLGKIIYFPNVKGMF